MLVVRFRHRCHRNPEPLTTPVACSFARSHIAPLLFPLGPFAQILIFLGRSRIAWNWMFRGHLPLFLHTTTSSCSLSSSVHYSFIIPHLPYLCLYLPICAFDFPLLCISSSFISFYPPHILLIVTSTRSAHTHLDSFLKTPFLAALLTPLYTFILSYHPIAKPYFHTVLPRLPIASFALKPLKP